MLLALKRECVVGVVLSWETMEGGIDYIKIKAIIVHLPLGLSTAERNEGINKVVGGGM